MNKHQKIASIFKALSKQSIRMLSGLPFRRRFVKKTLLWGQLEFIGESIFNFVSPENISNPVLNAQDVTDVQRTKLPITIVSRERYLVYVLRSSERLGRRYRACDY